MGEMLRSSWRTTVSGLAVLICGMVLTLRAHDADGRTIGAGLIATGVGLVVARDQKP